MPLSVSFTFETTSVRHGSPSVRFMPNGTIELWRGRAMYPKLEVTHTTDDFAMECVGANYLLWSVVYDSGGEFKKCKRCGPDHMLGWKRKQAPQRVIEYGEEVDGFVPMGDGAPAGAVTHTNTKHYHPDSPAGARLRLAPVPELAPEDTYPVVRYRDLNADGARQFKAFLSCNSHFHGHHLFHIKVQMVELNARGEIIRAEVAYSPRIKVVSKFLKKKGAAALPVADVRRFLSMESLRKRRKLANLSSIAGSGEGALPPFPTTADESRRRKIPAEMTALAAEQEAELARAAEHDEAEAAAAAAASGPLPAGWTLPPEAMQGAPLADAAGPSSAGQGGDGDSNRLGARVPTLAALFVAPPPLWPRPTGIAGMDLSSPSSAGYAKGLSPASHSLFADPMLGITPSFQLFGAPALASPPTDPTAHPAPSAPPSSISSVVAAFCSLPVADQRSALLAIGADATSWQVLKSSVLELEAQRAQIGYDSE